MGLVIAVAVLVKGSKLIGMPLPLSATTSSVVALLSIVTVVALIAWSAIASSQPKNQS